MIRSIYPYLLALTPIRRASLTLEHVWIIVGLGLMALASLFKPIVPNDFWWHLATGRLIVETGQIPLVDSFSFTQTGQSFYDQSWLAQVMLYELYRIGDIPLIILVHTLIIVLGYTPLLWLCIRRARSIRLGVGILLLTLTLSVTNWSVRPQTYAIPLFIAFLVILWLYRESSEEQVKPGFLRGHYLWLLPPLMVVWVNLHGSFVLGEVLIALTLVAEVCYAVWNYYQRNSTRSHKFFMVLGVWGVLTALAMLLNPRGIQVVEYVRNLVGNPQVTNIIEEWSPPSIRDLASSGPFYLFTFILVGILIYSRRKPDPVEMLVLLPFLWLALSAWRSIIWFGVLATPLLVSQIASFFPIARPQRGNPLLNLLLVCCIGLLLVAGLPWIKPSLNLPPAIGALLQQSSTPVQAVAYMRSEPADRQPQRIFNDMGYGSYLMWATPDRKIFIDPRIELYPAEQWQDYLLLASGANIEQIVQKYRIDGLLLNTQYEPKLIAALRTDKDWEIRYQDEWSVYFVQRIAH